MNESPVSIPTVRKPLPEARKVKSQHVWMGNRQFYIMVGLYDDNTPGEIFITSATKSKDEMADPLLDAFSQTISMLFQYGIPLEIIAKKFIDVQFGPNGETSDEEIPKATSILDYIFKWLMKETAEGFPGAS